MIIDLRLAIRAVADVLAHGERNHAPGAPNHWEALLVREHLTKALAHGDKCLLDVDPGEDHLAHCATRLLLALERREREQAVAKGNDDIHKGELP